MEWLYPKRRGPEWKHGWTGQTLASITTPPLPLLAIFAIVIFLLCLSQYTKYKANIQQSMINFQLVLFLVPVLLIFVLISGFTSGRFNFRPLRPYHDSTHQSGGSPWAVAILVMVLLVLVSYQSSFHSKWLGYV
ncbi:DNA polymerase subunit gamma-1 like [Actinidia chinensis var. chinensis]|uniref:DNA polymerase subunit gamma-1 like n=1 Tax=Actinidia chinensis var. chinensis TaxID=1590841 RepID=A0A2R6R6V2_ACTCC|nr:DNA polymerase subunit gamma-1 like [Actinidia chinensis var. chinensis]